MAFSERDKQAARVIVSIFETNRKAGNPAALAVLDDGAGISYGMHQATHRSGTLAKVVEQYILLAGKEAGALAAHLPGLKRIDDDSVAHAATSGGLKVLLKSAGADPVMRQAQLEVFDRDYLNPAIQQCETRGWTLPLSLTIVYDSHIQGSWARVRDRVSLRVGRTASEQEWMREYLHQREEFLLSLPKQSQKNSVYRPRDLRQLADLQNWQLAAPMRVHGVTILEADLA